MRVIIFSVLLMYLLAGCSRIHLNTYFGATENAVAIDQIKIERGRQLYLEQYCGVCHQFSLANTRGTFAPSHDHMGSVASQRIQEVNYTGTAKTSAEYIRESLLEPQLYYAPGYEMTNHQMPSYEHLPPEYLDTLVYLLDSQR